MIEILLLAVFSLIGFVLYKYSGFDDRLTEMFGVENGTD